MAVTVVGTTSANGGVNSVTSVSVALHASAAVGDLAILVTSNDRGTLQPVVTAPTVGYVTAYAIGSTNVASEFGWKRLTAGDLAPAVFTATYGVNPNIRRAAIGIIVLRGADDPVFTTGAYLSTATAQISPTATPSAANSLLVALFGFGFPVSPYTRTFTPSVVD